jgi:nucleotide-binding universal stress UspA family protein
MVELCAATDLSPSATPAVELAFRWAKALGGSVLLLHVVHDPVLAPALANDAPGEAAAAKRELQQLAEHYAVPTRIDVRTADDVGKAIVEASAKCDYVFVGSHGKSGFQRLRLGSIAAAVLRHSHVPVVCLPAPKQ